MKAWYKAITDTIDLTDEYDGDVLVSCLVVFLAIFAGAFVCQLHAVLAVAFLVLFFAVLFVTENLGNPVAWSFVGGFFLGSFAYGTFIVFTEGAIATTLLAVFLGLYASFIILSQFKKINRRLKEYRRAHEVLGGWPIFALSMLVPFVLVFSLTFIIFE